MAITLRLEGLPEFTAGLRQTVANSSRTIERTLNSRMFYVAARTYVNLDPQDPQAERNRIRGELLDLHDINNPAFYRNKKTGKRGTRRKRVNLNLQARHLIINAIRGRLGKKGLYGRAMYDAAAKFVRTRLARVGFMKAALVHVMRRFSIYEKFTQHNAAVIDLQHKAQVFGAGKVSILPGSRIQKLFKIARPGAFPAAEFNLGIPVHSSQRAAVASRYQFALQKAINSEIIEMKRHLGLNIQAEFDKASAAKKFRVYAVR